jgi:[ribosomal protein S18]-alanine N-acetyltransferase
MFSLFAKAPPPAYRPIGPERSAECAMVHAASFAYPWDETDFEQLLVRPEVIAEGAIETRDCSLAGFILSRAALDEAEILTIAVLPERRRCGLAAALLSTHLAELWARGVTQLFLEVDANNVAARSLYAANGFHQIATRESYYRKKGAKPASALVMRLDLSEQV